jgi:parallel beta-helix repeat protein
VFDVTDYGAHADGVTDDVDHIQAAIDACSAAGGGYVYLPAGTYYLYAAHSAVSGIGCCLQLRDGVVLLGDGAAATFITSSRAGASCVAAWRASAIGVVDLKLTNDQPVVDCLKFQSCARVSVYNVLLQTAYTGINLMGCSNSVISDSIAYGGTFAGFVLTESERGQQTPDGKWGVGNTVRDCEAHSLASGFRVTGRASSVMYARDLDAAMLERCYAHDNTMNFNHSCASNLTMNDCTAEDASNRNVYLAGVHTALLHDTTYVGSGGTSAYVVTNIDGGTYTYYGDSSGIVEN